MFRKVRLMKKLERNVFELTYPLCRDEAEPSGAGGAGDEGDLPRRSPRHPRLREPRAQQQGRQPQGAARRRGRWEWQVQWQNARVHVLTLHIVTAPHALHFLVHFFSLDLFSEGEIKTNWLRGCDTCERESCDQVAANRTGPGSSRQQITWKK